ncbi:UBX domain-containing protein 2A [Rhinatrema bivittatum]|uniref:UBX domain-containing protein 2A n=1 Tax=Rhinatrema bivittatum TaxID=194408 RepID=UPI00112AFA88|nr:UBX domain-containing protein 2A [Rhinatrema bivittatum]
MREVDKSETIKQTERVSKQEFGDWIAGGLAGKNSASIVDGLFKESKSANSIDASQTDIKDHADMIIQLWKNGFTVNGGDLRTYTDVENQQFLESMKKGELPLELQKVYDKEEVDVKVEDKKDKECASRKPVFYPFSGQGYRLGSATPRIISKVQTGYEEAEMDRSLPVVVLSDLEPITNIQIWLADGRRIVQKFNVSSRISQVRDFIERVQGCGGNFPFTLTTSLPLRELLDETLTLEEAHLQNAVLVQRIQKTREPFSNP